jgi:hypothetical protein
MPKAGIGERRATVACLPTTARQVICMIVEQGQANKENALEQLLKRLN